MDLDNTLLNRDKNIIAYTVAVLKRCREKGHRIAFATARAENAMQRFIDAVKAVCDSVIDSNDRDGVAKFLDQKLLYQ